MRVGSNEELDVYISDWNVQQIELQRDDAGRHVACWTASDSALSPDAESPDGEGFLCVLEPWVPVRFGAVILCIGPSEGTWPDDAQLLLRCFAPTPAEPPMRQPLWSTPLGYVLGAAMTVTTLLMSSATPSLSRSEIVGVRMLVDNGARIPAQAVATQSARPMVALADPAQQVRDAIDGGLRESLEVVALGDRVMVRGVLPSRNAVDELHRQLDLLPSALAVSRRVLSVGEIVDRLHESLPVLGLNVRQTGPNRFELSGTVEDVSRATRAVQPVAADLGEFGLQIDIALQPRLTDIPTMSGMLIDSEGTSFLRTRDGVKHIVSAAQARASTGASKDLFRKPTQLAPQAPETPHATR